MRNGSGINDAIEIVASALESAERLLSPWADALNEHGDHLNAKLLCFLHRFFSRYLRGIRRALPRPLETTGSGRSPGKRVTLVIGDCDDCIIETRTDTHARMRC